MEAFYLCFAIMDSSSTYEAMMKLFNILFFLLFSSIIYANSSSTFNHELEKIPNSNPQIILLFKKLDFNLSNSLSAYPGKLQFEQMKKTIESSTCLKIYQEEVSKPIYKAALDSLESKFVQFDQLLKKYSNDTKFKDELIKFKNSVTLLPKEKVCHFEIPN